MNIFRASAPVRLDFAGAWTDVSPFASQEGGVVVNAAIALHAHAEITVGGDRYHLRSDDLDDTQDFASPERFPRDGRLELLKAALRLNDPGPCQLRTWSEAPPGSGLGTSGALDVALVAALDAARGVRRSRGEVAEAGYQLETGEAGHAGGRQDQYAAAFGGFNRLAFSGGPADATSLQLDPDFAASLEQQIVVCYTGQSRISGNTISRVMSAYERREARVVDALRSLVGIAERMTEALRGGELLLVGSLLRENWLQQQRLDPAMCSPEMQRLEAAMDAAGSLGGKAAGAGAGGSMFFVMPDAELGRAAAESCGVQVLPLQWASQGIIFG